MKNRKKASSIVYIVFFLIFFIAMAAFAVDSIITYTNREKLQSATEIAALNAASSFNDASFNITSVAQSTFKLLQYGELKNMTLTNPQMFDVKTFTSDPTKKMVLINSKTISKPFFLSFLGVKGINIKAKVCAVSEQMPIKQSYGGNVIWLSSNARYEGDIVSLANPAVTVPPTSPNYNDTAILPPLGNPTGSASYPGGSSAADYSLINLDAALPLKPLSLGPGGFITIKLPAPLTDKPGNDLYIKEVGDAQEGYMVYAGLDNDPKDAPYIDHNRQGSGLKWINISCSAKPDGAAALNETTKIYGSANFDLGAACLNTATSSIGMAKYIRIIDDNNENAYYGSTKYNIYGEASTATAGADIDYVLLLNHVRLIPPSNCE